MPLPADMQIMLSPLPSWPHLPHLMVPICGCCLDSLVPLKTNLEWKSVFIRLGSLLTLLLSDSRPSAMVSGRDLRTVLLLALRDDVFRANPDVLPVESYIHQFRHRLWTVGLRL